MSPKDKEKTVKALTLVLESESERARKRQAGSDESPISNGIVVSSNLGEPWCYISVGRDDSGKEIQVLLDREWGDSVKRVIHCSLASLASGKYRVFTERPDDKSDGKLLLKVIDNGWVPEFVARSGLSVIAAGEGVKRPWSTGIWLLVLGNGTRFKVIGGEEVGVLTVRWYGERLILESPQQVLDPRNESLEGAKFL